MRIVISLSKRIVREADRHARRTGKSRSQLYTEALVEYLARRALDDVTAAMDRVCGDVGAEPDPFILAVSRKLLKKQHW